MPQTSLATSPDAHAAKLFLRSLFDEAVQVADPMRVIPKHLPQRPKGRVIVIGAGKASARMAEAVEMAWGPCEGLVITRYGYARQTHGIKIIEAAHPVADQAGMNATQEMLSLIQGLGPDDLVLALISGGGSALLCAPLSPMSLNHKQQVHSALLASGAPIGKMNTVRKHLSRVKGGQLAAAAYPAQVCALMISDVPGDDPADIASGATVGETSTAQDARDIIADYNLELPSEAITALTAPKQGEKQNGPIAPDHPSLSTTQNHVISAPSQSLHAAENMALDAGFDVRLLGDALEGEARDLGEQHAQLALDIQRSLSPSDKSVLLLSGGECTVTRNHAENGPTASGGPNAEYALAMALILQAAPNIYAIACDTDGIDGAADVAGALIEPDTLLKAKQCKIDAQAALERHDSHSFFASIDDQVITGPTLTNVNDFRAILIKPITA
jgi:hydroxypyruvate reductase